MTPNDVAKAARRKAAENPVIAEAMRNIWDEIAQEIDAGAQALTEYGSRNLAASRKRAARLEFLTAFLEDADPAECTARARKAGGL